MALRVGFRKLQGDCFKLHHRTLKVVIQGSDDETRKQLVII